MIDPLISVIMPIYNAEKRLELSINSILSQTYKNLELILVNDGSTDGSEMICNKYSELDKRVKVIHQQNSRVSAARNRGIQNSQGQFITFLDSDDILDAVTYETVMKRMLLDKSIDVVIFGMRFDYYKNNAILKSSVKSIEQEMTFDINQLKEKFFYLLERNYLTPCWNKVIKASIIKENNLVFEEAMSILEDFMLVLNVLENSKKICALPDPLLYYYNDLQASRLKRRPNIDYVRNFQLLDRKLRRFSKKFALDQGVNVKKINGMILRYYLKAIEKLFLSSSDLSSKYHQMKRIIILTEFQVTLNNADITGLRFKMIHFLLVKRKYRTLFLLFFLNEILEKVIKLH